MEPAQEIYAQLFIHVDAATSLLLKEELVDAEFIRAENQRIFAKLGTVQDAATLQYSRQASEGEAEHQSFNEHNVSTEPTRLGNEDGHGFVSGYSFTCLSDKCLHLDGADMDGDALDESTLSTTDSPRTLSEYLLSGGSAASSEGNELNTGTGDHQASFPLHPVADRLNHSYISLRSVSDRDPEQLESCSDKSIHLLVQDGQDPQLKISDAGDTHHPHSGQNAGYASPSNGRIAATEFQNLRGTSPGQSTDPEQDTRSEQDLRFDQDPRSELDTHPGQDTRSERGTHPEHGTFPKQSQKRTLSSSPSYSDAGAKRMKLRSNGNKTIGVRRVEESNKLTSPEASLPESDPLASRKRKGPPRQSSHTSKTSRRFDDLKRVAYRVGNTDIRDEIQETCEQLSEQPFTSTLRKAQRQSDVSTIFNLDPGQFIRGLPVLRLRLESHFVSEQMFRTRKRIDFAHFYNAYMVAQDNPDAFLKWTAKDMIGHDVCVVTRSKGRKASQVKQRLVEILFSESILGKHERAVSGTPKSIAQKQQARKTANQKVEDWRRSGKPWSELIRRFGYGILLLVPSELTDESVRTMTEADWVRLLDLIESRRSHFEDLLATATRMVEKFFLCPASTPAVEFDTLPIQVSLPQSSPVPCTPPSSGVSLPAPRLSTPILDVHQPNTRGFTIENATLLLEEDNLEEPHLQLCSQSRTEAGMLPVSSAPSPGDRIDTESAGLGFITSTKGADSPIREQSESTLALEGSILHDDFGDSSWPQRDVGNTALPTPDWSSGFGFSAH